jgi:hypothetical protein
MEKSFEGFLNFGEGQLIGSLPEESDVAGWMEGTPGRGCHQAVGFPQEPFDAVAVVGFGDFTFGYDEKDAGFGIGCGIVDEGNPRYTQPASGLEKVCGFFLSSENGFFRKPKPES